MRAIISAVTGFLIATSGAASGDTVFSYRGRLLMPRTGNGVPGVRHLHFRLSGAMPEKGACVKELTIRELSDGAYSIKELLDHGFVLARGTKAEVCSDASTGALSERLDVQVVLRTNGALDASYSWKSNDPVRGKSADTVTLLANAEYHVSVTKAAGHLMAQAADTRPR